MIRFRTAWDSYREVNKRFATAATTAAAADCDCVFIEDSHLMLLSVEMRRLRRALPPLSYFHHVAWCTPEEFSLLPAGIRSEILESLMANDYIGFHAQRWLDNFAACCGWFMPDAVVRSDRVEFQDRSCRLHVNPAAIDLPAVRQLAAGDTAATWRRRMRTITDGRRTLVRVDRADIWKNALRGFDAYEALLAARPDMAQAVVFVAALTHTRTWIPEYRDYAREIDARVCAINNRFRSKAGGRDCVVLSLGDPTIPDWPRALAVLAESDAVLINPLRDGLNIVAKEAIAVGERNPAIALSRTAGVHEELEPFVVSLDSGSTRSTEDALHTSLTMALEERGRRRAAMLDIVSAQTPRQWALDRLATMESSA
jgi:trehalose 6-phosphate synthase